MKVGHASGKRYCNIVLKTVARTFKAINRNRNDRHLQIVGAVCEAYLVYPQSWLNTASLPKAPDTRQGIHSG